MFVMDTRRLSSPHPSALFMRETTAIQAHMCAVCNSTRIKFESSDQGSLMVKGPTGTCVAETMTHLAHCEH